MNLTFTMFGQLALTHVLIMGAITYFTFDQPGPTTGLDKAFLAMGWLIPIVGPIFAGILILLNRKRRS